MLKRLLIIIPLILPLGFNGLANEREVPSSKAEVLLSFAPVVEKTAPTVVNIYTQQKVETNFGALSPFFDDPVFKQFFGDQLGGLGIPRERIVSSLGSGVIVRSSGLIVTNNHVVKNSDQIKVVLSDRKEFDAKVVLSDQKSDLAFLKISPGETKLPAIEIGNSDQAKVGDLVLAIGNPFGVGQSVTSGIVSALSRTNVGGDSNYHFFIQTDASINPGNSGGALVTLDGKLVGINTAIFSKNGGSLGIGFAIPSNMVESAMLSLETDGKIVRPWFGASLQDMSNEMSESLGFDKPTGVIVKTIYPESPADSAGLKTGDIILALDNNEASDSQALYYRLATKKIGSEFPLKIFRDGKKLDLNMRAESPPEKPKRDARKLAGNQPLSGATAANISPALATEIGMNIGATGVVLLDVNPSSTAGRFGFQKGDLIEEINQKKITSSAGLEELLQKKVAGWQIVFIRGNERYTTSIRQ